MNHFSVIICTFNRPDFLRRSLESALSQSYHPHEVLVVDAGEVNVLDLVAECRKKYSSIDIKHLRIEAPNVCVMRNVGANHASGRYLVFLDDDDYWSDQYLSKLEEVIEHKTPEIILTSTWKIKNDEIFPYKNAPEGIDVKTFIVKNNGCMGSNICIDKDAYQRINGFDETLPSCDDMDFAIRIAQNGLRYFRLQDRLVYYQSHQGPRQSMRPHPVLLYGIPKYYLRYKELMYPIEREAFFERSNHLWKLGLNEIESLLIEKFQHSFLRTGTEIGGNVKIDYLLSSGYWSQLYVGFDSSRSKQVSIKILFPKYDEVSSRWGKNEIEVPSQLAIRFRQAIGEGAEYVNGEFYREYKILARIYPNDVEWFECFGTYAIIYPFFEGINIRNWVRRTKITPERIETIIRNLEIELNKIHSLKILHRDLHPNNILADEDDRVRVVDFGKSVQYNMDDGYLGMPPFSEIRNNQNFFPPSSIGTKEIFQDIAIDHYALKSLDAYLRKHHCDMAKSNPLL